MVDIAIPKFMPGRIVATQAALRVISDAGQSPLEFLNRHTCGDWGRLSPTDRALNDGALQDGSRIFSAYVAAGGRHIWIITDAADDQGQRESTTILLPEEY